MPRFLRLSKPIDPSSNVDLNDVLGLKRAFHDLGYYSPPSFGMHQYPDRELFGAIKRFQADNRLTVDGIMKPEGETVHALNTVLRRKFPSSDDSVPGSQRGRRIDASGLYSMFDQYNSPEYYPGEGSDGDSDSSQCCASGTCDIAP